MDHLRRRYGLKSGPAAPTPVAGGAARPAPPLAPIKAEAATSTKAPKPKKK